MPTEPTVREKGDTVEGYRVLAEIGRGAASIVYLVQDPKSKRVWALKHVEKLGPKDQRFLDQAVMEYKIANAVNHDSVRAIPKLVKKGSPLNPRELYLVMEFVDGEAMDTYRPPDMTELVDIFRQTASALAAMHEHGYVHADMKPHNVMVCHAIDGGVTAKVIDLGQSCKSGTVKERIQGTPDYIAPEQVSRDTIVPKTDVYNLGATIYWVLTRQHIPTAMPKDGASLVSSRDATLIEKPTPAHELNPHVDDRLSELVSRCVEPVIDDRPTMTEVADRLELVLGLLRARAESAVGIELDDEDD